MRLLDNVYCFVPKVKPKKYRAISRLSHYLGLKRVHVLKRPTLKVSMVRLPINAARAVDVSILLLAESSQLLIVSHQKRALVWRVSRRGWITSVGKSSIVLSTREFS